MVIYPHPDDETMAAGGLLLLAKKLGWRTIVVTLTVGEAGQNHLSKKEKALAHVRRDELEKATGILGVDKLVVGDFPDGKLKETREKWSKWIHEQIKIENPGLVVTYDHSGMTGHPDHISLSVDLFNSFKRGSRVKLLWNTVAERSLYRRCFVHKDVVDIITKPDWELDLGWNWIKKWKAAVAHRSQHLGKSMPIPLWLVFFLFHKEWYHEVDLTRDYPYKYVEFKI